MAFNKRRQVVDVSYVDEKVWSKLPKEAILKYGLEEAAEEWAAKKDGVSTV